MITSEVIYQGDLRTEARHSRSGRTIITDAPVDNNGKGEAFSPTDLVATALASCIITIMGIKANGLGFELGKVQSEVVKIMATAPRRIVEIQIQLKMPSDTPVEHRNSLELAGKACPVAKSLHPNLKQVIRFSYS